MINNTELQEMFRCNEQVPLERLKDIFSESGYICLGNGTGRRGNSDEPADSIFKEGLRTKDNSLYYTTIVLSTPTPELIKQYKDLGIPKPTISSLKQLLNNWPHLNSKRIILVRIPIKYINKIGNSSDLDSEKFGAFMIKRVLDDGTYRYYLDPRFIIGCYNAETETVRLNKSFEINLSDETKRKLQEGYKAAVKKTERRINITSSFPSVAPAQAEATPSPQEIPIGDFDDNIDWDIPKDPEGKGR